VSKICFYRQKRRDGGLHTGVLIEGGTALELDEGIDWKDQDPVLVWWVDVRCEGKKLPLRPEPARQWLLDHTEVIQKAFETLAQVLEVGLDQNTWPLLWPVPIAPRGTKMVIGCCALYRSDGLLFKEILTDLAAHWREWIKKLPIPQRV
jgi:hypothetical protein